MRNIPKINALLVLFLLLGLSGCSTSKPEDVAYKVSKSTHITAIAALKSWNDFVKEKHPPVEQEKKVQAAWDTYKLSQLALLDATKAYMEAGASPPATVQERFDAALAAAGAALADFVGLVQQFGAKL